MGDKTPASGEATQQVLRGLEDFKSLDAQYRALNGEIAEYRKTLAQISHRLSTSGSFDGALDVPAKKRYYTSLSLV